MPLCWVSFMSKLPLSTCYFCVCILPLCTCYRSVQLLRKLIFKQGWTSIKYRNKAGMKTRKRTTLIQNQVEKKDKKKDPVSAVCLFLPPLFQSIVVFLCVLIPALFLSFLQVQPSLETKFFYKPFSLVSVLFGGSKPTSKQNSFHLQTRYHTADKCILCWRRTLGAGGECVSHWSRAVQPWKRSR